MERDNYVCTPMTRKITHLIKFALATIWIIAGPRDVCAYVWENFGLAYVLYSTADKIADNVNEKNF